MKIFKEITKYILVFIVSVVILTTFLTLVAKIPKKYVEVNLKEATNYFKENKWEITKVKIKKEYSYLHPYADEIILNIIYCLDTNKPLESVLEAKYYTGNVMDGSNQKYIDLIQNNLQGNTQYMRYWHGSIVIIKPLLTVFTLEQIYMLNAVVLSILAVILLMILVRKKYYSIAIALVIGLIMVAVWYVPFTFEYFWTFLLMFIASIIAVCIENKNAECKDKKIYMLFFLIGILTCFLDFLTTEIITILVPLTIILSIRIKEKNLNSLKKEFMFLIKSLSVWGVAYCCMWFAKWGIASAVLKINAMDYVKENALMRINGRPINMSNTFLMKISLIRNFLTLFPINLIKQESSLLKIIGVSILLTILIIIDKKEKEKMKYFFLMLNIATIPYIRYAFLSNHSYMHMFMTFRSQLSTIMCIILIIINCSGLKEKIIKIREIRNKIWKK